MARFDLTEMYRWAEAGGWLQGGGARLLATGPPIGDVVVDRGCDARANRLSDQEALVRDVLAVGWAGLDSDDLYPRRLRDLIARAAEQVGRFKRHWVKLHRLAATEAAMLRGSSPKKAAPGRRS